MMLSQCAWGKCTKFFAKRQYDKYHFLFPTRFRFFFAFHAPSKTTAPKAMTKRIFTLSKNACHENTLIFHKFLQIRHIKNFNALATYPTYNPLLAQLA